MPYAAAATDRLRTLARRFGRNPKGDAAVQFALIAPLFFALLFAIIETGLMFLAQGVLETVTQNSARFIMTGQAQNAGYTQAQFKTYVCGQIPALFNCNNIYVDVKSFPAFSNVSFSSPTDASGNFVTMNYDPGASSTCTGSNVCQNSIVVVRSFYAWQLFVTGLGYNISNMAGNQRLLTATAVFRNEPY